MASKLSMIEPAKLPPQKAKGRCDTPVRALIRSYGLLRRVMDRYLAQFGVSGSQWSVLRALARAEEDGTSPLRLTDLGENLLVRPPSVTGVVDRLQRMGLLTRLQSPEDHRAKRVSLTAAGRERVERVLEGMPAQIERVLGGLGAAERQQLHQLLEMLALNLETLASESEES